MDKEHQESDTISEDTRLLLLELETQRNELREYIDQLTTLNARLAPDGTILMINATAANIEGVPSSELVGRKFWKLPELGHTTGKQARIRSAVRDAAAGKLVRMEITHPTASGDCITVVLSLKPVMDANGRTAYLVAEGRNITERKRIEEALRESEDKYRTLIESANDAIFLMDYDRFIDCNKKTLQIFGCTRRDQIIGHSPIEYSPKKQPDGSGSREKADEKIRSAISGSPQFFEWRHTRLDGSPFDVEVSLHAVEIKDVIRLQAIVRDVTDRKRAEEALRESAERFRSIAETTNEWIWEIDMEGRHLYSNPAAETILGYSPEEIYTINYFEIMHEDDRARIREVLADLAVRKKGWREFVIRWRHKDGSFRWLESNAVPVLDENGEMAGFRGADRDITERKQAEEALRESEERYSRIVNLANEGISSLDENHIYNFVNSRMAEMLGYSPEEIIGRPADDFLFESDIESHHREMKKRRLGIGGQYERRWRRADGSEIWTLASATALTDSQGRFCGSFAMFTDITERKRIEAALRESEKKYRSIFENSPIGIFRTLPPRKLISVNPASVQLFGYDSEEEMLDRISNIEDLFVHPERRRDIISAAISSEGFVRYEVDYKRKDGSTFIANLYMRAVRDEKGDVEFFEGFVEDITDRRHTEDDLRREKDFIHHLLDSLPGIFYLYDSDLRLRRWNRNHENATGYSAEELFGIHASEFFATDELWKTVNGRLQRIMTTGKMESIEVNLMRKDQSQVPYILNGLRIDTPEGPMLMGVGIDITERKQTEEQLKQSLSLLRATLESTADGILVVDRSLTITDWNQRFARMWQVPQGLLESRDDQPVLDMVSAQLSDRNAFMAKVQQLYSEPEAESFDILELRDGRVFERYSRPQYLDDKVVGRVWSFHDVTDLKLAEKALLESEERLAATLQNTPNVSVQWLDNQGRILFWNKASESIFGWSSDEAIGKTLEQMIFTREEEMQFENELRTVQETGQPQGPIEYTIRRRDGSEGFLLSTIFSIPGTADSPIFVCMDVDITERKQAEEEKRRFYRETISSVTDGRLIISDRTAIGVYEAQSSITRSFVNASELSQARQQIQAYCESEGLHDDSLSLFMVGIGEAMTNALKHASGGRVFCGTEGKELWVGVSDKGTGIATLTLPRATLQRGYSTKVSMGMGYSIMLDVADRVMLSTGPQGTIVIMFKHLFKEKTSISLDDYRDTWDAIPSP